MKTTVVAAAIALLAASATHAQSVHGVAALAPQGDALRLTLAAPVGDPPAVQADPGLTQTAAPAPAPVAPAQSLIDINPLALIFGELSWEYEHAFAPSASYLLGVQGILFPGVGAASGWSVEGGGVSLGIPFFPGGEALHGFWIGPEVNLSYATLTQGDVTASGIGVSATGILGYTWLPHPHIPICLGIGAGYGTGGASATDSNGNKVSATQSGLALNGRFAVGYAW